MTYLASTEDNTNWFHKRKEKKRKGKERKGKERKGKERKTREHDLYPVTGKINPVGKNISNSFSLPFLSTQKHQTRNSHPSRECLILILEGKQQLQQHGAILLVSATTSIYFNTGATWCPSPWTKVLRD
jgi:hypothetical protein